MSGFAKHIVGHVYMAASHAPAGSYRLQDITQQAVANATIALHPFGNAYLMASTNVGTAADGAYAVGTNELHLPLFVEATVTLNGEVTRLFAPVPSTADATVTVDIDLASTMVADYIFAHGGRLSATSALLDPAALGDMRQALHQSLSDQNAPDPRNPTQVYNQLTRLAGQDAGLKGVLDKTEAQAKGQVQPATPGPAPTTIVPANFAPGPAQSDPPLFSGSGSQVTATPKPASYLDNVFTGLRAPGMMAAIRFKDLNQVFMAAIDHQDNSLFAFFRDAGSPTHLAGAPLGVGALQGLALDAAANMYVVGPAGLARLALTVGTVPTIAKVDRLSGDAALGTATAIALTPDASAAYVACSSGDVLKFGLPTGNRDTSFKAHLSAAANAVAVAPTGVLYVAYGPDGAIAQLDASGNLVTASYAKVVGVTSLSVSPPGSLYAGSSAKQVMRVRAGQPAETFLNTLDGVTGVSCLGGYLYLTESSGILDSLTTAE